MSGVQTTSDVDVDLRELFASLARKWPRILIVSLIVAGIAFALAWVSTPLYMGEIFDRIVAINKSGVGILMVEQNARQALELAGSGFVLAGGVTRYRGTGAELLADPEVARSFLGGGGHV